jgi:hypothetical protein
VAPVSSISGPSIVVDGAHSGHEGAASQSAPADFGVMPASNPWDVYLQGLNPIS